MKACPDAVQRERSAARTVRYRTARMPGAPPRSTQASENNLRIAILAPLDLLEAVRRVKSASAASSTTISASGVSQPPSRAEVSARSARPLP